MRAPLLTLPLLPLLSAALLPAQTTRYRDQVFTAAQVTTNLTYGSAVNRWTNQTETLLLDLYQPRGDTETSRPALVYVHGGGFVGGDKGAPQGAALVLEFVRRGYVGISINYRLQPPNTPITQQTVTDAKEDCKAAIRWLRRNATTFGIDVDRIASIGSSAGAFTVLEAAYVDGEGNSGNPGFRSDVRCVVDLWGRLWDLNTLTAGEPPVFIAHGVNDTTVLYRHATDLAARAALVNVPHELHPLQGGHAPWNLIPPLIPDLTAFLYEHLALGQRSALVARPGATSPGTLGLDAFSVAGDTILPLVAAARVDTPIPPFGTLCLDPLTLLDLPAMQLPGSPRLPTTLLSYPVPAGYSGLTVYFQLAAFSKSGPRWLSNCAAVRFP